MSCDEVLPEDLIPIKDVNEERVQQAGRFAVEEYNKINQHHFIYKRVVGGRSGRSNAGNYIFSIEIEVLNDDGILWSLIAKVQYSWNPCVEAILCSF